MNTPTSQPRKARFHREPADNFRLQKRDREIIRHVYEYRFLTSEHIIKLLGGSRQGILRRLHYLYHGGYLDRPKAQLKREGNFPLVYALGNKGVDLIAADLGLITPRVDWTTKNREAKPMFLEHTLMVSDIMLSIELSAKKARGVEFVGAEEIIERRPVKPETLQGNKELAWRVTVKKERNYTYHIIPDNAFGLHFPTERETSYFFLEADRSTMPVTRHNLFKTSFYKKLLGYWESWHQGLFKDNFHFRNPRVLTVTLSEERIRSMIKANKEIDPRHDGLRMFLFTTLDKFSAGNPLKEIWTNGRGEPASLLD